MSDNDLEPFKVSPEKEKLAIFASIGEFEQFKQAILGAEDSSFNS